MRFALATLSALWVASFSSPATADSCGALLARGTQLFDDGLFERSLELLAGAEQQCPRPRELAEILLFQGLNHFVLERPRRAERLFVAALRIDPSSLPANIEAAQLLIHDGMADAAREYLERVIQRAPDHALAHKMLREIGSGG